MKKNKFILLGCLISFCVFTSCGAKEDDTKAACDCVEQFNYYHQDGGMMKLDMAKLNTCVDKFKDANASSYPDDINTAERNARNKCK